MNMYNFVPLMMNQRKEPQYTPLNSADGQYCSSDTSRPTFEIRKRTALPPMKVVRTDIFLFGIVLKNFLNRL